MSGTQVIEMIWLNCLSRLNKGGKTRLYIMGSSASSALRVSFCTFLPPAFDCLFFFVAHSLPHVSPVSVFIFLLHPPVIYPPMSSLRLRDSFTLFSFLTVINGTILAPFNTLLHHFNTYSMFHSVILPLHQIKMPRRKVRNGLWLAQG